MSGHIFSGVFGPAIVNGECAKSTRRNDWRASLVPAAAVIPAPVAYIKVVAVKTLVVWLQGEAGCE